MTQQLTPMERRVYQYLLDFTAENTFQPSIRDIGRRFQIRSTKTVSDLLQSLAAKGYIERDASRSRGVRLLGFSGHARAQPVPFYERIHAGEPALHEEDRSSFLTVDRRFLPDSDVFAIRAEGSSMSDAGILAGDYVIVKAGGQTDEDHIAVLRVGEEAVLRHVIPHGEQTILRAANAAIDDEVEGGTPDILGVVCGVFRPFQDSGPPARRDLDSPAAPADVAGESAAWPDPLPGARPDENGFTLAS